MLIWRLKFEKYSKWKYCSLAVAVPLLIAVAMRVMVSIGAINVQISEQTFLERVVTSLASILLIAGPFIVTVSAMMLRRKRRIVEALQHQ